MIHYFYQSKYPIVFVILLLTTSCVTQHFMYAPTAVNAPAFTQKNESYVDLAGSYRGVDAQAGYAVSDHVAVLGSWYWRRERHYDGGYRYRGYSRGSHLDSILYNRHITSLGVTYYGPLNKRNHIFFNISAGYGLGRFIMDENSKIRIQSAGSDSIEIEQNYYTYDAHISRFFFQPALVFNNYRLRSVLSVRWAGTRYKNIRGVQDPDKYGHVSNKLLSYIEPALTSKIYLKDWLHIILQIGASINTQQIDYDYRGLIGNVGIGIDPVKLLGNHVKKPSSSNTKIISL